MCRSDARQRDSQAYHLRVTINQHLTSYSCVCTNYNASLYPKVTELTQGFKDLLYMRASKLRCKEQFLKDALGNSFFKYSLNLEHVRN